MERANATVRVGGSMLHTVRKQNLTPPEVVLLKVIHGHDAVVDIERGTTAKFAEVDEDISEIERLCNVYGEAAFQDAFPGHAPQLPLKFKDIGIDLPGTAAKTTAQKSATKKGKAMQPVEPSPQVGVDPAKTGEGTDFFMGAS